LQDTGPPAFVRCPNFGTTATYRTYVRTHPGQGPCSLHENSAPRRNPIRVHGVTPGWPVERAYRTQSNLVHVVGPVLHHLSIRVWRIMDTACTRVYLCCRLLENGFWSFRSCPLIPSSLPVMQSPSSRVTLDMGGVQIFYLSLPCPSPRIPFFMKRALEIPLQPGLNSITGCGCPRHRDPRKARRRK
jgi:hypothetical protein